MFISKSVFHEIGKFDPNIFMYYEESDLQLKLKKANYHNYIIDGTKIIHLEGASINQAMPNNNKRIIVTKSMFYYFRKHSKNFNFKIFKIFFLTFRFMTILSIRYTWKEKKEYLIQIIKS